MTKILKIAGICFASVIGIAFIGGFLFLQNCLGRMHECYSTYSSRSYAQKLRAPLTQFTASAASIAFPVMLDNDESGLLFINRNNSQVRLIYEKGKSFWSPSLSTDGKLILIRHHDGTRRRDILSCAPQDWHCDVLLRTEDNLRSPVKTDTGAIIYSSSPLRVVDGPPRYHDWDFYLLEGSQPVRLSSFGLYSLHAINVVKDKIIFSAFGNKSANPVLQQSGPLAPNRSEIYELEFDGRRQLLQKPSSLLEPLFKIGGYSIQASISLDGSHAAVLNTETGKGKYRFEMVLARMDGTIEHRINLQGIGFSPAAFAGETLLYQ